MLAGIMESLTDDQVALLGCGAALLVTGTLMSLSFYIGKGARARSARPSGRDAEVIVAAGAAGARDEERRRAA